MNERVIEAAAKAIEDRIVPWEDPEKWSASAAESAIRAADAARAEEVLAAVDALIAATQAWNIYTVADNPDVIAARRDLFALLNIPEAS
jgi:hypothetical protein